jgi:hypothetical protein
MISEPGTSPCPPGSRDMFEIWAALPPYPGLLVLCAVIIFSNTYRTLSVRKPVDKKCCQNNGLAGNLEFGRLAECFPILEILRRRHLLAK